MLLPKVPSDQRHLQGLGSPPLTSLLEDPLEIDTRKLSKSICLGKMIHQFHNALAGLNLFDYQLFMSLNCLTYYQIINYVFGRIQFMLSLIIFKEISNLVKTNSIYEFLIPVRPTHFFLIWDAVLPTISSAQRKSLVVA